MRTWPYRSGLGLTAVFVALMLLLMLGWIRAAKGRADEAFLQVGRGLTLSTDRTGPNARSLSINGNLVMFSSRTVQRSLEKVVEGQQARCDGLDGSIARTLETRLAQAVGTMDSPFSLGSINSVSGSNGRAAYVACLDLGPGRVDLPTLIRRFEAFTASGNLGELGVARYLYASAPRGSEATTFVLEFWAASLDLGSMLRPPEPATNDDRPISPRGSVRVLDAHEPDGPGSVSVYTTQRDRSSVVEHYERAMSESGYRLLDIPASGSAAAGRPWVVFGRRNDRVSVVVVPLAVAPPTTFTLLDSRSP